MTAQGDKFRNRPEEDLTTRRTAEDELMRGDRPKGDRGVGQTGGGSGGGSGTAGGGVENEGTGSLLVDEQDAEQIDRPNHDDGGASNEEGAPQDRSGSGEGSGSTQGGRTPGVSGQRGVSSPLEKEGQGHSGPIRSGGEPATEQDRAAGGSSEDNAREGYEDHGGSRDDEGTKGESSGSRPGYR